MADNTIEDRYLIFTIQEKQYALPSKLISEVAVLEKVFPLPLVPGYVRGIINRYSVPYALIDICFLLQKNACDAGKVIVLKEEVDKLAFLINDVTDIADLPAGKLIKIVQEENSLEGTINSFFEWKGIHVFCLDTAEILSRIKLDFEREG